jgi:putative membrane protein
MSRRLLTAPLYGLALLGMAFAALGQGEEASFLKEAIEGNLAEVRFGALAAERAENRDVRAYGQTLRQDHTATLARATNVAKSLKVEAPTEPPQEADRKYDGLAQLSGGEFDAAFLSHMVVSHEMEIAKYTRNASSNDDAVAALVADALPKLKTHLAAAQALQRGEKPQHLTH